MDVAATGILSQVDASPRGETIGMTTEAFFMMSEEVEQAVQERKGVVALETAVLTHGLPFPDNLETMARMERAVRRQGSVPAVVGLHQGQIIVGIEPNNWEALLNNPEKCSLRDLGIAMARGRNGGTTVAATAYLAHRAGIRVFATGGIGGVHRGWTETLDVSADLYALANVPMIVVSSGAKSILDLPKTMEVLESLGVPVVGYRTAVLPGFYVRETGLSVSSSITRPGDIIAIDCAMRSIGMRQALLLVQPGPLSVDEELVEALIGEALAAARAQSIVGKQTTPFLLEFLNQHAGDSLKAANIALLENNASLAAQVAAAFHV